MFTISSRSVRALLVAGAGAGLAVGLAACGGSSGSSSASPTAPASSTTAAPNTGPHNQADITFAQGMIPHHEQAIEMSKMVPSHTSNAQIQALAKQIEAAQGPEIAQLQSWLQQWGASPAPTSGGHDAHGGMMPPDSMMTAEQMQQLNDANGAAFDTMWLQMMIQHHEGAVTMAKTELADGENPQAKQMAQAIIDGQTKEIAQMKKMLAG